MTGGKGRAGRKEKGYTRPARNWEERSAEAIKWPTTQHRTASKYPRIQIPPLDVPRLNQRQFPGTRATLDLLLARDRLRHRRVEFEPHEQTATVARRKTGEQRLPVFPDAPSQVGCDARVESAVLPPRDDVDRGLLRQRQRSVTAGVGADRNIPHRHREP